MILAIRVASYGRHHRWVCTCGRVGEWTAARLTAERGAKSHYYRGHKGASLDLDEFLKVAP